MFTVCGTIHYADGFTYSAIEARDEAHARRRVKELIEDDRCRHYVELELQEICVDCVERMPEPPAPSPRPRLPYAVVLATRAKGGVDLDINTFEYRDLETARRWFLECCADPVTLSVTLEGPDGTQLADYSNHVTTAHIPAKES
jgi:hypothetical protein